MNAKTGKKLEGIGHLKQSITDILTTPIGTRVMRRHYGSRLFELIDHPMSGVLKIKLYAATFDALQKWEPRLKLKRVQAGIKEKAHLHLVLEGIYDGSPLMLDLLCKI